MTFEAGNPCTRGAQRVNLDHAATSPLRPAALEAMVSTPSLANPSATHGAGRAARALLEDAREEIAGLLGVRPLEIILTSGGTEADGLALLGSVGERGRVWVSAVEHEAVAGLADPRLLGERVSVVPVDQDGVVDVSALTPAPGDVVSVMAVNNETGVVEPVPEVAARAHDAGAVVHTDAVQALGHVDVDLAGWGVDLASFSAHKIGGPVGIGALWARRGVELRPVLPGGGQQNGVRSGTQTVMLARGFAAALRESLGTLDAQRARWARLRRRLVEATASIPGVSVDGGTTVSPAICHLTVESVRSADLLLVLDAAGIDCSAGSACHAGVARPSQVMLAMGRTESQASGGVRVSFGWSTTEADLDHFLAVLPDAVERVRGAR